jgi:hypothetical protein
MPFTFFNRTLETASNKSEKVNNFLRKKSFETSKKSDNENINIGGVELICRISDEISESTDMTQATLEDGSVITDHVVNRPAQIAIEGIVSNQFQSKSQASDFYKAARRSVGAITKYAPNLGNQVESRQNLIKSYINNQVDSISDKIEDAQELVRTFSNGFTDDEALTIMQNKMRQLNAIRETAQLIKIETPYKIFTNMLITSITHTHDNIDSGTAKFSIQAQEVLFAETIQVEQETEGKKQTKSPSSAIEGQADSQQDKGSQSGEPANQSALTKFSEFLQ